MEIQCIPPALCRTCPSGPFWHLLEVTCSLVATTNGLWKYRIYRSLCVFSNPKGSQLQGCIQAFPPKNAPSIFFRFFHPLQCFTQLAHKRHSEAIAKCSWKIMRRGAVGVEVSAQNLPKALKGIDSSWSCQPSHHSPQQLQTKGFVESVQVWEGLHKQVFSFLLLRLVGLGLLTIDVSWDLPPPAIVIRPSVTFWGGAQVVWGRCNLTRTNDYTPEV